MTAQQHEPVVEPVVPMPQVLLTVPEVAAILRVSKMTVYRMVRSGELESVTLGARNIRVSRASVAAAMGALWPGQ